MARRKYPAGARPHLSPSSLESLSKCGLAYQFRYIDGIIVPPTIDAARGKGVHRAIETNFSQKISSHRDLPTADLQDIAAESFTAEVAGGLSIPREDKGAEKSLKASAKDMVVSLAGFFGSHVAAEYQPILVEHEFRIELPGPRDLLGILDVATAETVGDMKTASKSKSQSDADSSLQLTAYYVGFHAETGRLPKEVVLDTLVSTAKGPKRNKLVTERSEADVNALAYRIQLANQVIDAGAFLPAPVGSWWCSSRWCQFWYMCPAVNSERRAAAENQG